MPAQHHQLHQKGVKLMKRVCLGLMSIFLCNVAGFPQDTSDTELVNRIRLNRSQFQQWDKGANLRERADALNKDVSITSVINENSILCNHCPTPDPMNHPEVKRAASESDTVVIGHVVRTISSLTANEAFVFTDSEFVIDQIWKDFIPPSSSMPLKLGDEITISTPGGAVISNGHKISAFITSQIPLQKGHTYLMYLKYIADSNSYRPATLDGFDLSGTTVIALRTTLVSPLHELMDNKSAFLKAMRISTLKAKEESIN